MKDWEKFEQHVRELASFHWSTPAAPETISGVNFDCVIKQSPDRWILIEVSQDERLDKVREDIAKFSVARIALFNNQNIYSECYFICEKPTNSMRTSGNENKVRVMSIDEFRGMVLGYEAYFNIRSKEPFGSAVNWKSGEPDNTEYVKVDYISNDGKRLYSIDEISKFLFQGEKIILLGDYGTGKSRCIREIFFKLRDSAIENWIFPIAIDLRSSWGIKSRQELLRRHFSDLGLSAIGESVLRLLRSKRIILLIDGFDEIASQTWSNDPVVLSNIRKQSLVGVSDLLQNVGCGVLITGREYYFNSHDEMFKCFGLNSRSTKVLKCSNEFSDSQILQYLKRLKGMDKVPNWLPKRPIICQVLTELSSDKLHELISDEIGEVQFWSEAIQAICDREANIAANLDSDTILSVLVALARLTRTKPGNVGPVAINEINEVFKNVTGYPPTDESAVILQRLPLLGRIEVESSDRKFVDLYFLDGLRAEGVCRDIYQEKIGVLSENWYHPLRHFGVKILSYEISLSSDISWLIRFLKQACSRENRVLGGDLICGLLNANDGNFCFDGLFLSNSHISCLDLTNSKISGLEMSESIIDELIITGANPTEFVIKDCIIGKVDGVSESSGMPKWMKNNLVDEYVRVNTVTRIKQAKLSSEQKVFVTIIKKTFFQPGSGRKEEALLRGLDSARMRRSSEKILNMLIRNGVLKKVKGKEGALYVPERSQAHRMREILNELTLSDDELWARLNPTD